MNVLGKTHTWLWRHAPVVVAGISAALLLTVYMMQHIGGLEPCPLCVTQRYPHLVAGGLALVAIFTRRHVRALLITLAGLALLATVGYATFHVGVEQGWFESACASDIAAGGSVADLKARLLAAPIVRCDEVPWSLFGISLAGWNAIDSLALAVFALYSGVRTFLATRNDTAP